MNPIIISKTNCKSSKHSTTRFYLIAAGASLLLVAGATSSCGTARGFGQDVEKTGDHIEHAASR